MVLEIVGNEIVGLNDYEAALQLQTVLVSACEGNREGDPAVTYQQLRKWAMSKAGWASAIPPFVKGCHDLPSFWSYIRGVSDQWEPRRKHVRTAMETLLHLSEHSTEAITASAWTGIRSGPERLRGAQALIPVVKASIEALIAHYELGKGNGGPPLDEHQDALEALRGLHSTLGDILQLIDRGQSIPAKAQREVVEYLGRAAKAVKDDSLPFVVSAMCMGVFTALGFPSVGGWLGAATIAIRKPCNGS